MSKEEFIDMLLIIASAAVLGTLIGAIIATS